MISDPGLGVTVCPVVGCDDDCIVVRAPRGPGGTCQKLDGAHVVPERLKARSREGLRPVQLIVILLVANHNGVV